MLPFIATLPILFTLIALIGLRKPAAYVAPLGWILSAFLAWAFWKATPVSIAVVSLSGVVWAGLVFVWGVFGAFFFLNFLRLAGILDRITATISAIIDDRAMKAVLVMFSFGMFLGAVAPAGSSFVVAGSMLLGEGIPLSAIAAMGMFGNGPQSPYGLLGVPVDALAHTTGLPKEPLSVSIALLFSFFVAIAPLWMVLFLGSERWRRMLLPTLIVGGVYGLVQCLTVWLVGVELANMAAGLGAIGATVALARRQHHPLSRASSPQRDLGYLVPFLVLIVLVLITRLVSPLKTALTTHPLAVEIWFRAEEGITEKVKFSYLYSPGTMAIASVFISIVILRLRLSILVPIFRQTLRQVLLMAVAVSSFAAMAHVMKDFGMNIALAQAMVDIAGRSFPLVSPLVGMLGTAITGSTTASNIFFGGFQMEVAQRLGLSGVAVGASQVVGCTAGEIICPLNALVITSGLGMKGEEGAVMRRMVPSTILYAGLTMVASFLFISYLAK